MNNINTLNILFVTDLLNTGETFKQHYSKIKNCLPTKLKTNIEYISILNNINRIKVNEKNNSRIRKIVLSGKSVYVHYILNVEVIQHISENCDLCKIGIPTTSFDIDFKPQLTSFEFWELNQKAGYGPEKFVPRHYHRKQVKLYPNIYSWIENNGPFIAYKFEKMLQEKKISINNLVIVLPDESAGFRRKIDFIDTPSGNLAYCLQLIHGIEYISIPRRTIDFYSKNGIEEKKFPKNVIWIRQLQETTKDILIADESQINGGTYEVIKKILSYLHKKPIGYFPIVDFNPNQTKINIDKFPNSKFLKLYEFQMS